MFWFQLARRIKALEERVREQEKLELELEELRRTATNAVRSLRRASANALATAGSPNGPPPQAAPLTLAEARRRVRGDGA